MTRLRLLLNSPFTGANAFLALADARGLFRDAGLDIAFTDGRGAYTAAPRLCNEGFDAAYGDLNALIEIVAQDPRRDAALAVYIVHQQAPSVISVAQGGTIHVPADLAGRLLISHASDVALQTFPAYAAACGLAPDAVHIRTVDAPMAELLRQLLAGEADGVFGYTTTHTAALAGSGQQAATALRFLPFRDHCPYLYGSALMVASHVLHTQPAAVRTLVHCVREAVLAAQAAPDEAIDAVLARNPQLDRAVELERWRGSLQGDMQASDGALRPSGDAEDSRLALAIEHLGNTKAWPHRPTPQQVFTRAFL